MKSNKKIVLILSILIMLSAVSCKDKSKSTNTVQAVTVDKVISKTIPVYYDFVGNTQSIQSVDITARVEGYLIERNFKDGQNVKKGELLFVIDPRTYQASLDEAEAQLEKDRAALNYALEQVARYKPLVEKQYITTDEYDQYVTQTDEALAAVKADEAQVVQAELNLSYCYMYAPFSGRIGRRMVDVGNLVGVAGQDNTLATLVKLDPIYVYFSPTERDIALLSRQFNKGKLRAYAVLPDEKISREEGYVDFIDNTVDESTGTLTMRAVIPNPDKLILPGQYTKIRLYVEDKPDAVLVPQKAIMSQQGENIVYVLGSDNKVKSTKVTTGSNYEQYTVIEEGLKAGEVIVTDGLQKIHDGEVVDPKYPSTDTKNSEKTEADSGKSSENSN